MTTDSEIVEAMRKRVRQMYGTWQWRDVPLNELMENALAAATPMIEARERERCARIADAHRCGEQLIRHKMSEVDQVGVVAATIAKAIRGEDAFCSHGVKLTLDQKDG